ncbi:MAG: NAD(P)/FAD-dependent oxidoreductase, partial [Alphaproteobacteria bacterium]
MTLHVVVIGAGIVGAATAFELIKSGHRVTIVDPGAPGGAQAASYGNGAWISSASIIPMSVPGLWRKVPGYLLDRNGPLTIRWQELPRLLPWLLRFLAAGATVSRVEATARALSSLLCDAPTRHAALANQVDRPDCVVRSGVLYAYPRRADFESEALAWRLRRDNGLRWVELDSESLHRREPALADHYRFGILVENAAHCPDPGVYVDAIVEQAIKCGAILRQSTALGFEFAGRRLKAVLTNAGPISCDRAVIAAGIWSKDLAKKAGDNIP